MIEDIESYLPNTLEEAYEILKIFYKAESYAIKNMTEEEFICSSHFGAGMFLRNNWFLWWHEDHGYENWPKEKPILVEFFNSLGIYHADDISAIILTSFYRSLTGKTIKLKSQVRHYKAFWRTQGFKDGIYKTKK